MLVPCARAASSKRLAIITVGSKLVDLDCSDLASTGRTIDTTVLAVQASAQAAWWQPATSFSHRIAAKQSLPGTGDLQGLQAVYSSISSGVNIQSRSQYSTQPDSGPDITQLRPLLQQQWHQAKNAHLGNVLIRPFSQRKVWWFCNHCPNGFRHEWESTVGNRTSGSGCPFCSDRAVCRHNSLVTKAPAVAAQFSSKNQGTAHDYLVSSNKTVMWQCELGHEWKAAVGSRTSGKVGCRRCFAIRMASQPNQRHPTLTTSQHPMLKYWDWKLNEEAGLDPTLITCRSNIVAHWCCPCCPKGEPHRWQARVAKVYDGRGCPVCAGRKACICNSLQALFPEVAAEWDTSRNQGTLADCTAYSSAKVWWHNDRLGHFQAVVSTRTVAFAKRARAWQPVRSFCTDAMPGKQAGDVWNVRDVGGLYGTFSVTGSVRFSRFTWLLHFAYSITPATLTPASLLQLPVYITYILVALLVCFHL